MRLFPESDWRKTYQRLLPRELLNRIRNGDARATHYLMETYRPVALALAEKQLRGQSEAVGDPAILANDVLLCLWTRASTEGGEMLKHDNDPIVNWLRKTVFNYRLNADRREQKFLRDETNSDNSDEPTESLLSQLPDFTAADFADTPAKEIFPIVEEALAMYLKMYPKGKPILETLVRKRWMEGLTWKRTADFLFGLYPDHDPVLDVNYVQKSYWDKTHKQPFFNLLRKALERYGYGF